MSGAGLVIAAPRSSSGKTTLTLGLLRAFMRRGVAVAGAKCGPDYIDPAFHAAASGRASVNLDSWAMPPELLRDLAARAAEGADLVICEGLMGLFDGVPGEIGGTGSTADIAAVTGWPVLLVLDVSGQSTTAAAIVKGCAGYDPRIRIGGVVLNRVGSDRHRDLVSKAIEALGIPVLGSLPRSGAVKLPERHLGLVQAEETSGLEAVLDAMADFVEAHVDVGAVIEMAAHTLSPLAGRGKGEGPSDYGPALERTHLAPHPPSSASRFGRPLPASGERKRPAIAIPPPGQRIALARDEAFSFIYPHLLQGWREAGAEIIGFSPLADEPPPEDCDICWLPGGYPELHAGKIAAATRFLDGLRRFAATKPVHGECGGYMALGQALVDASGERHALAGLLSVVTSFAQRKLQLGYRKVHVFAGGVFGPAGARLRGHEFHYSTILDEGRDEPFALVSDAHGGAARPVGGQRGLVTGSFFHAIARDA